MPVGWVRLVGWLAALLCVAAIALVGAGERVGAGAGGPRPPRPAAATAVVSWRGQALRAAGCRVSARLDP